MCFHRFWASRLPPDKQKPCVFIGGGPPGGLRGSIFLFVGPAGGLQGSNTHRNFIGDGPPGSLWGSKRLVSFWVSGPRRLAVER